MRFYLIASFLTIGLLTSGCSRASGCSSPETDEVLHDAISNSIPPVDQATQVLADVANMTWKIKDYLALGRDGYVLKCEAIAKAEFPIKTPIDPKFEAYLNEKGIQTFSADAEILFDLSTSKNGNSYVKITKIQFSNNTASASIFAFIYANPNPPIGQGAESAMKYNEEHPDRNMSAPSSGLKSSFGGSGKANR